MACGVVQSLSIGGLCRISSDLVCMGQRELRRAQYGFGADCPHTKHWYSQTECENATYRLRT